MSVAPSVVVISAASSFTGMWLAKTFVGAGSRVFALFARENANAYEGTIQAMRLHLLEEAGVNLVFDVPAESGAMAAWIHRHRFDLFIHHHHHMLDYRVAIYDLARSRKVALEPLPELIAALEHSGVPAVIYSSTYFENLSLAESPYGFSKGEVWKALVPLCVSRGIALGKVIIGNPIGAWENEDRLIPSLVRASRERAIFALRAPAAKNWAVPVSVLCTNYLKAAAALRTYPEYVVVPSLGAMTNAQLAEVALLELVQKRLGLAPCQVEPGDESLAHEGVELGPVTDTCDVDAFWDTYATRYRTETTPTRRVI